MTMAASPILPVSEAPAHGLGPALREVSLPDTDADADTRLHVPADHGRLTSERARARALERRPARTLDSPAPPPARADRPAASLSARSEPMRTVLGLVERLAVSSVTVTVLGETGSGKDVLAHALHDLGPRAQGPFVVFDCASVPANLVESELFGHERGSFTGAYAEHVGAFERALGGTLFLDEIGELPLDLQPRLLRALDGQSFRRVGGTRDRRLDVRVVAATNRDLAALVTGRHFRQDLYFRLAAATVHLPPLRERLDDLPLLVPRLLADIGHHDVRVADATWPALRSHPWPGNVRELKNALALAMTFCEGGVLEPRHFRFTASAAGQDILDRLPLGGYSLEALERAAIRQTLIQTRGNKIQAARLLGIAASTLYEKLQRYRSE